MAITNQRELQAWIDIEDSSGDKQGTGPITSIIRFVATKSMDRAGSFEAIVPLADPQSSHLVNGNYIFCYALVNGEVTEIGNGRITEIAYIPSKQGTVAHIKGFDLLEELTQRTVEFLVLGSTTAVTHPTAISAIENLAPAGWTFVPDPSPFHNEIVYRFAGESVLQALIVMTDFFKTHFRLDANRTVTMTSTFEDSGIVALDAPLMGYIENPAACFISKFSYMKEINSVVSRIYPYGGWYDGFFSDVFIGIDAVDSPNFPYTGYTHDLTVSSNWIQKTSTHSTYGLIERQVQYPQIKVTFFTGGYSAAIWADLNNLIYNRAVADLELASVEGEFYTLSLANCDRVLKPLQSLQVILDRTEGENRVLSVNETLFILESTIELTANGVRTTSLNVANIERYMRTDPYVMTGPLVRNRFFNDQYS